jgi:hypothetical protein
LELLVILQFIYYFVLIIEKQECYDFIYAMQFENLPNDVYYSLFKSVCNVIALNGPKVDIFDYMKHYEKLFNHSNRVLKNIKLFGAYIYFNCIDLKQLESKVNVEKFNKFSNTIFVNPMITYETSFSNKESSKSFVHFNPMVFTSQITEFNEWIKFIEINKFRKRTIEFSDEFRLVNRFNLPVDYV